MIRKFKSTVDYFDSIKVTGDGYYVLSPGTYNINGNSFTFTETVKLEISNKDNKTTIRKVK